ncbi:hypothetical protein IWX64_003458, partial [Arthrobacter sp. CAN_A212]
SPTATLLHDLSAIKNPVTVSSEWRLFHSLVWRFDVAFGITKRYMELKSSASLHCLYRQFTGHS